MKMKFVKDADPTLTPLSPGFPGSPDSPCWKNQDTKTLKQTFMD